MTTCIIPAAGKSSRFQELGKHYPKCVLPYQGRPIIQHIVENVKGAIDPSRFIIVALQEHVAEIRSALEGVEATVDVIPLDTSGFQGPGRSIFEGIKHLCNHYGDDEVFVHLSDAVLSSSAIKYFYSKASETPTATAFFSVRLPPDQDYRRWCAYDQLRQVLIDKPSPEQSIELKNINARVLDGLYLFDKSVVVDILKFVDVYKTRKSGGEFQISELINMSKRKSPVFCAHDILDFGTVQEYLANKGAPRSRSFNSVVKKSKHEFVKESSAAAKLAAEANFYQNAPLALKPYFPRVLEFDGVESKLTMENIRSINLRDLYVYIDRSFQTWVKVFQEVRNFNTDASAERPRQDRTDFWKFVYTKTLERTKSHRTAEVHEFLINFQMALETLSRNGPKDSFYHGDLHFANMFYCFTYGDLKLVDPRGEFVGNIMYDIAKLMHSVYGRYDWIDGEFYSIKPDGSVEFYNRGTDEVKKAFEFVYEDFLESYRYELLMLTASLFLTMIPLHTHSPINQKLYYEEFLRIWSLAKESKK